MFDAVLSYHLSPLTCGVAKANSILAARWGIPLRGLDARVSHALISVKPSELPCDPDINAERYTLWLHGPTTKATKRLVAGAERVFYAEQTGVPAMINGNPTRPGYRVLTFGMAHKRVLSLFERLKVSLDILYPNDYSVCLSTGVHEGYPWEASIQESEADMRAIFGDKFRFLGALADDALAKELQDCDAVAAFFEPGFRANNTSVWAAVAAGKPVYTNRDDESPELHQPPTWDALVEALRA